MPLSKNSHSQKKHFFILTDAENDDDDQDAPVALNFSGSTSPTGLNVDGGGGHDSPFGLSGGTIVPLV